jgi:hypothetical protein
MYCLFKLFVHAVFSTLQIAEYGRNKSPILLQSSVAAPFSTSFKAIISPYFL